VIIKFKTIIIVKRKVVDAKKNINVSRFGLCPERGSWDFAATLIDVHGPLDLGWISFYLVL